MTKYDFKKMVLDNYRFGGINEELKKKLSGDCVCDGYCAECMNGIIKNGGTDYYCKLDCKCMDFKKKVDETQ